MVAGSIAVHKVTIIRHLYLNLTKPTLEAAQLEAERYYRLYIEPTLTK